MGIRRQSTTMLGLAVMKWSEIVNFSTLCTTHVPVNCQHCNGTTVLVRTLLCPALVMTSSESLTQEVCFHFQNTDLEPGA